MEENPEIGDSRSCSVFTEKNIRFTNIDRLS
jgi:hypothetical protein